MSRPIVGFTETANCFAWDFQINLTLLKTVSELSIKTVPNRFDKPLRNDDNHKYDACTYKGRLFKIISADFF